MIAQFMVFYLVVAPSVGLSSTPGETPSVSLYVEGETEQTVHFRLYEVPDPEKYLIESYQNEFIPKDAVGLDNNGFSSIYAALTRESRTFRYWLREILSYDYRNAVKSGLNLNSMESKTYNTKKRLPRLKNYRLVEEWDLPEPVISYSEDIDIPGMDTLPQRLYLLEVSYSGVVAYVPVLKTSLYSILKVGKGVYLAYLADSGIAPMANAKVTIIENGKKVIRGYTDNTGTALFQRSDSISKLTAVFVSRDGRVSICGDYAYGWFGSSESPTKAYVYTDRPIYKPGHTVYITGILRKRRGFGYLNAPNRMVVVKVSQGWGETRLMSDTLLTDEYGAFSDSLVLPDNAKLGSYYIDVTYNDESVGYASFDVQEYVKPEFKVSISTNGDKFVAGDEIRVSTSAEYIFGAPLKGGTAELTVRGSLPWWYYYPEGSFSKQIYRKKKSLDENGNAEFVFQIPYDSLPFQYMVIATVTAPDGRKITSIKWLDVYPSAYIPTIRLSRFIYTDLDSILSATVRIKDINDNPVSTVFTLSIYRGWRNAELLNSQEFETDRDGEATITMPLPFKTGDYYVVVRVKDPRGREMVASDWFYRASSKYRWGSSFTGLSIKLNRDTLAPGDTINGILTAQIADGHVLMTLFAGDTLLSYDVVKIKNNVAPISLVIPHGVSGGIRLRADLPGPNEGTTSQRILVVDSSRMLNVKIKPNGDEFEPGKDVTLRIRITNSAGLPEKAAFSIAVVDEAIYQLRKDNSGNIFDEFYLGYFPGWMWSISSSYFGFYSGRNIDLTQLASNAEKSSRAEAVAQFKEGETAPQNPMREKFKDVAFWRARGRTNSNGEAVITFKLPDNITQWRITVKAYTKDTKLGQGIAKFYARKRVFVTIALPRYLTVGDTIQIPTVVHNFLGAEMEFKVNIQSSGLKILREGPIDIRVPSNGSKAVLWPAVAETPGSASVMVTASTFRADDAIKIAFPVNQHGLKMSVYANVEASDGSNNAVFVVPDLKKARELKCEVTISSGYITAAMAALPYLKGYPYGCVEQTMSRFLPDIIVRRIAKQYDINFADDAQLNEMIQAGLKRLYSYQHYDGGWGWWRFDDSDNGMTAYVMWGLALASQSGVEINPSVIKNGLEYIRDQLNSDIGSGEMVELMFAYSFYDTLTDEMKDRLRNVNFTDLTARQLAKFAILAHKVSMDGLSRRALQAFYRGNYSDLEITWIHNEDADLAWKLMAYVETGAKSDREIQMVADSLIAMRRGLKWSSTLSTAYSVMALADVSNHLRERKRTSEITLIINNHKLFKDRISSGTIKSIKVPIRYLKSDTNTFTLKSKGTKSFASLTLSWFSGSCPIGNHSVPALSIKRELYQVSYKKSGGQWVPVETPILSGTRLRTSSRVKVRLTIAANEDIGRLIVEDPVLPGAEIDEADLIERYIYSYWDNPIAGLERKNDHIAFAIPYISDGDTVTIEYVLFLQNKGVFHLMPAVVYGMYMPDLRANSKELLIKVD